MASSAADLQTIETAANQIGEAKDAVESTLQQLQSQLEGPIANWKGAAADKFRELKEQYEESGKKILQKLQELGDNVQSSGRDYAATHEEQAAEVQSAISAALDG